MGDADIEILDVVIVLRSECAEKPEPTVQHLETFGLKVESHDHENGVIEGTLPAGRLADVRGLPCVSYCRVDFEYIVGHPVDDDEVDNPGHSGQD